MRESCRTHGFTMIELLMVIMLVAILGATALPQFLDFRNEAKVAALRQTLTALRVGLKNQLMQARLKCNATETTFNAGLTQALIQNDITASGAICTTAQVPNPADRPFWNFGDSERVPGLFYGLPSGLPKNALYTVETGISELPFTVMAPAADPCASIPLAYSFGNKYHWLVSTDGQIYPGTNTAGIQECAF